MPAAKPIPNGSEAVVEFRKLTEYCLNPDHMNGRHKARVFRSVLGIDKGHAGLLLDALMNAARSSRATEVQGDSHGRRFVIDFRMEGPKGAATVRSAWIIRTGELFPRFVTCFVLIGHGD